MAKPQVISWDNPRRFKRLLKGPPSTFGLKAGLVTLKPQESVGEHTTKEKEEAVIILKGKAEIVCGCQTKFIVKRNSLVYIPRQTFHNVKNIGRGLLRYIYITCPSAY